MKASAGRRFNLEVDEGLKSKKNRLPWSGSSTAGGLLSSAVLRFSMLPIGGLSSLLVARTLNESYGIEIYGFFALVSTLPSLLPSLDFGLGAAVTNRAAASSDYAHDFIQTFRSAFRRLCVVAASLLAVSVTLYATQAWPMLLGLPRSAEANLAACAAVSVFALSLPAGVAAPSLLGFGRNRLLIVLQAITPVATLLVVWVFSWTRADSWLVVGVSTLSVLMANWATFFVVCNCRQMRAAKRASKHDVTVMRRSRRHREFRTAGPMLIVMTMGPLTFQTGRISLSWFSGPLTVGQFSAGMIVFSPVFSIAQVAGRSLWSQFAKLRSDSADARPVFLTALRVCFGIGMAGGLAVGALGPLIASWATAESVSIPKELFWLFGAIVLVTALHQPGGMYLTDASGLRFQALTSCIMAAITLSFIFLTIHDLGIFAPVAGTLIGLTLGQFVPCLTVSLGRLRKEGARA